MLRQVTLWLWDVLGVLNKNRANLVCVFLVLCVVAGLMSTFTVFSVFSVVYQGSLSDLAHPSLLQLGNGFGTDYRVSYTDKSLPFETILANWRSEIPKIKSFGFNTVRLAFAFNNSGDTTHSTLVYSELDQVLTLLDRNGLNAVLDLHNYNDMPGFFGSPGWIQSWTDLASHYKNDQRIVAYELFNEPFTANWYSGVQTGGAGGSEGTGCLQALAQCVDAIRSTGDDRSIVYPDPYFIIPYSQRMNPEYIPPSMRRPNIIMTFHFWYGDTQTMDKMNMLFAYREKEAAAWQKYYTVWIGEYGWYSSSTYDQAVQQAWLIGWTQWAIQQDVRVSWWLHGYTGGRAQAYQLCKTVMQAAAMPMPIQTATADLTFNTSVSLPF